MVRSDRHRRSAWRLPFRFPLLVFAYLILSVSWLQIHRDRFMAWFAALYAKDDYARGGRSACESPAAINGAVFGTPSSTGRSARCHPGEVEDDTDGQGGVLATGDASCEDRGADCGPNRIARDMGQGSPPTDVGSLIPAANPTKLTPEAISQLPKRKSESVRSAGTWLPRWKTRRLEARSLERGKESNAETLTPMGGTVSSRAGSETTPSPSLTPTPLVLVTPMTSEAKRGREASRAGVPLSPSSSSRRLRSKSPPGPWKGLEKMVKTISAQGARTLMLRRARLRAQVMIPRIVFPLYILLKCPVFALFPVLAAVFFSGNNQGGRRICATRREE